MNASSSRIGVLFTVTREMVEAARDLGIEEGNINGLHDGKIAAIYRAMRALEPANEDISIPRAL